jgi:transcriptional regulator NrdR family protein
MFYSFVDVVSRNFHVHQQAYRRRATFPRCQRRITMINKCQHNCPMNLRVDDPMSMSTSQSHVRIDFISCQYARSIHNRAIPSMIQQWTPVNEC